MGITSKTPEIRFQEHQKEIRPAYWTMKYKPISIFYKKDLGICSKERAELYERRVTRKYINKYGLNNVRGGDLRDIEPMVQRFGWFWDREGWKDLLGVILLMLIILFLGLKLYLVG